MMIDERPKLIYASNARIPSEKANSIQSMNQCKAFSECFQVSFWHAKRVNELGNIEPFGYYGVERSFSLNPISSLDIPWLWNISSRLGFLIQAISYMICLLFRIAFWRSWKFLYDRNGLDIFLLPFIKLIRFDIIILIEDHDNLLRNLPNVKIWFLQFADGVITTSSLHHEAYLRHGFPKDKLWIVPNGVDLKKFGSLPFKKKRKVSQKEPLHDIYYIGNLFHRKGVFNLANAAIYLTKEYRINFVGGSKETLPDFERHILQIKNQADIKIHGHIKPTKIPKILSYADIVVIPNSSKDIISSHYTSPLKLFEYMAAGKAIIASELPSLQELLQHNHNAWLVKPDNAETLAEGIKYLSENPNVAQRLAKQASEDVKNYSYSARANKIYDFFSFCKTRKLRSKQ